MIPNEEWGDKEQFIYVYLRRKEQSRSNKLAKGSEMKVEFSKEREQKGSIIIPN
jgi:hypothetical protein